MCVLKMVQATSLIALFLFPISGQCADRPATYPLSDTLFIDTDVEELEYYVHNDVVDGKFVVQGTHRLKLNKTKANFSGVIVLKYSEVNYAYEYRRIMTYKDGIPHGQWKAVDKAGNPFYEVGVSMGFLHGICRYYSYYGNYYNSPAYSVVEISYQNGRIEGEYKKSVYASELPYSDSEIGNPLNMYKKLVSYTFCKLTTKSASSDPCKAIPYESIQDSKQCSYDIFYRAMVTLLESDDYLKFSKNEGVAYNTTDIEVVKNTICGTPFSGKRMLLVSDYVFYSKGPNETTETHTVLIDHLLEKKSPDIETETYGLSPNSDPQTFFSVNQRIIYKNSVPVKRVIYLSPDTSGMHEYKIKDQLLYLFKNNRLILEEDTLQYYKGYVFHRAKRLVYTETNFGWYESPYYLPESLLPAVPGSGEQSEEETKPEKDVSSPESADSSIFYSDETFIDASFDFNTVGKKRHGWHKGIGDWPYPSHYDLNSLSYIVNIENKFTAKANYCEGAYYLGEKTGVWNYYLRADGVNKKIASEKYVLKIPPTLANFKVGMPVPGIACDWDQPSLPDPIVTEKIIYNYENGNIIIGVYYDMNGNVVKVVK